MPSSKGYKRNYKQEWAAAKKRGEDVDNNTRHRARYEMEKAGKVAPNDGKDVGHVVALSKGGSNDRKNLRVQNRSTNRSFARNKDGSMRSERSRKEFK
jgi:hypothetical protein